MTNSERLESYHQELARGQQHLQRLDQERQETHCTILRLQGAIAAMGEVLKDEQLLGSADDAGPVLTVVEGGAALQ